MFLFRHNSKLKYWTSMGLSLQGIWLKSVTTQRFTFTGKRFSTYQANAVVLLSLSEVEILFKVGVEDVNCPYQWVIHFY